MSSRYELQVFMISQFRRERRARRQRTADEQWAVGVSRVGRLDRLLQRVAHMLILANKKVRRRRYICPEVELLLQYETTTDDVERFHSILVQRLVAPKVLNLFLFVTFVILAGLLNLLPIEVKTFAVNTTRVLAIILLMFAIPLSARLLAPTTRMLVEIRSALVGLNALRRPLILISQVPHGRALQVRSERIVARSQLRRTAHRITIFTARSADRNRGDPRFEECTRLEVWIHWAIDDIDDITRIHRAIRGVRRMAIHLMNSNLWEIPDIPKPPTDARMPPPSKWQRMFNGIRWAFRAGSLTALLGVVALFMRFLLK